MAFGIPDARTKQLEAEEAERAARIAHINLMREAITSLPCQVAMSAIITAIKDHDLFTVEQLYRMSDELGREAHARGRAQL